MGFYCIMNVYILEVLNAVKHVNFFIIKIVQIPEDWFVSAY
jgi:hypothetical protein